MTQDFWSRRKAKVAAEQELVVDPPVEEPVIDPEMSDQEVLAALELPDPDTLELGDDIKGFLSKAVPAHLRRRALRKLWRLNPVLANLDGLNDYDGDFTDKGMVEGGVKTAYKVGKGMLAHLEKIATQAQALEKVEVEPEPELDADAADASSDVEEAELLNQPTQTSEESAVEDAVPAPRRRMRFAFEQEATT